MVKYFYCDFDSRIFKRKWYRLNLSDEDPLDKEYLRKTILGSDADYVDLKLRAEKSSIFERSLKELKFRKICDQITLCCGLDKQILKTENYSTYCASPLDSHTIDRITDKCYDLFNTSRFSLDEMLEKELVLNFFRSWIKNSLSNNSYAKFIWNNSFCTLKPENEDMIIDLIAVPSEDQRKGIGSKLISDAINYSKNAGYKHILSTTETENHIAIKLYLKYGFEVRRFTSVFHLRVDDLRKGEH